MYFTYRTIDSYYDYHIKPIIGARGIGKTYGISKKIIKNYLYDDEKFIWIRDNENALKKLLANDGEEFFKDIRKMFPGKEFSTNGEVAFLEKNVIGYFMPLSTYYNYKGCPYGDIKTVVFDEFIKEKAQKGDKYNALRFMNTLETIGRTRTDYNVYMLSNALDRNSDFFDIFGIKIDSYGIYKNKEKGVVLQYAQNSVEYDRAHNNSIVGKLIKGTIYEETIMNNTFLGDDNIYYTKKPPKSTLLMILVNEFNERVEVWACDEFLYIENNIKKYGDNVLCAVSKRSHVRSDTKCITVETKNVLRKKLEHSKVRFLNGFCFNLFIEFLT